MTLVQLRHLIALVESASFSRAAKASFVTQPALSRSIRALEDELGQPLVDRIGRRLEPTAFGRDVLARARAIVFEAEELRSSGRRAREGASGRIAIGLGSGPAALLTAPLLLQLATAHPRLRVELATGNVDMLTQAMRNRTLDAMVFELRAVQASPDLKIEPVAELRGAFLARRGHPLLRRRKPVRFADLLRYPLVSTPLGPEVARSLVEQYGPEAHPEVCVTQRCEDIASLVEVARQSDAVVLAIRAAGRGLVEIPLKPALAATARFGVVTLAGRSTPPALPIVLEFVKTVLKD